MFKIFDQIGQSKIFHTESSVWDEVRKPFWEHTAELQMGVPDFHSTSHVSLSNDSARFKEEVWSCVPKLDHSSLIQSHFWHNFCCQKDKFTISTVALVIATDILLDLLSLYQISFSLFYGLCSTATTINGDLPQFLQKTTKDNILKWLL